MIEPSITALSIIDDKMCNSKTFTNNTEMPLSKLVVHEFTVNSI